MVEAGGAHHLFQVLLGGCGQFGRAGPAGEEVRRDHVHARVGALGGQHGGHQQFPGVGVVQGGNGLGISEAQALEDDGGAFG